MPAQCLWPPSTLAGARVPSIDLSFAVHSLPPSVHPSGFAEWSICGKQPELQHAKTLSLVPAFSPTYFFRQTCSCARSALTKCAIQFSYAESASCVCPSAHHIPQEPLQSLNEQLWRLHTSCASPLFRHKWACFLFHRNPCIRVLNCTPTGRRPRPATSRLLVLLILVPYLLVEARLKSECPSLPPPGASPSRDRLPLCRDHHSLRTLIMIFLYQLQSVDDGTRNWPHSRSAGILTVALNSSTSNLLVHLSCPAHSTFSSARIHDFLTLIVASLHISTVTASFAAPFAISLGAEFLVPMQLRWALHTHTHCMKVVPATRTDFPSKLLLTELARALRGVWLPSFTLCFRVLDRNSQCCACSS